MSKNWTPDTWETLCEALGRDKDAKVWVWGRYSHLIFIELKRWVFEIIDGDMQASIEDPRTKKGDHMLLPEQVRKAANDLGYPWVAEDKHGIWRMFKEAPKKDFQIDAEVSKGVKILVDVIYSGKWEDSLLGPKDALVFNKEDV